MKVLWFCNLMLPQIAAALGEPSTPFGGWMTGTADALGAAPGIQLAVCFPQTRREETLCGETDRFLYFGYRRSRKAYYRYDEEVERQLGEIVGRYQPDVVHIWGTEYPHALAMLKAANAPERTVVSIQGLCGPCSKHYLSGVPFRVKHRFTVRDALKMDNLAIQYQKFCEQGRWESLTLESARHVIGRTEWDYACATQLAPGAKYHFCNESLRESFYQHRWKLEDCERHSIFVSQWNYPLKGFHFMLQAMPEILRHYPDATLYTTGRSPFEIPFYRVTSYQKYVAQLIERLGLHGNVVFTGLLDEERMCDRFRKSHVFVSASNIENSPNSVGEAMILGVPVVASYVGGVGSMLAHNQEGLLYPSDEPYILASQIIRLFGDDDLAQTLSENASRRARQTHDPQENTQRLMEIYWEVMADNG